MPLSPGTPLGPFEITAALGAGGMGEVYRARDPRLGRDVAVKVLPTEFGADPDRLRRFEQEARAAAALSHPNILQVHDIGTHDGAPYLVVELLDGETLRAIVERSPLPVRKALDYAVQIARGLAAAHERGVIHRDIKPDNVFVTPEGRVKILDFGLAKLTERGSSTFPVSQLPTTPSLSDAGMVLGTAGYMAPEQVRGQAVDHRADIFALGCVLYEMLTGRRAFPGETPMDAMSAILREDPPDLSATRPVPPALDRVIRRCLEKNPAARFKSADDLAFALESAATDSQVAPAGAVAPSVPRRRWLAWIAAAAVLSIATMALLVVQWRRASSPPAAAYEAAILLPEGVGFAGRGEPPGLGRGGPPLLARGRGRGRGTGPSMSRAAVSPDGRRVAFIAGARGAAAQIWVRTLDTGAAQPLAGTDGAQTVFWSADSRFIGFVAGAQLRRVEAGGGAVLTLADAAAPGGASWSEENVIIYTAGPQLGLMRVAASGGTPAPVTELAAGDAVHLDPWFLPDGRHFLYLAVGGGPAPPQAAVTLRVGSLDGEDRVLLENVANAKYANGHLLFMRGTTLMAQRFDVDALALAGDAIPVAERVAIGGVTERQGAFSVSQTGALIYEGGGATASQLTWFDRAGRVLGTVGEPADYQHVEISPDGARAAVTIADERLGQDIWVVDLARGLRSRVTSDAGNELQPVWSPDGRRIAFHRDRAAPGLYVKDVGTSAETRLRDDDGTPALPEDWSPDGRFILYQAGRPQTNSSLWLLPVDGGAMPRPLRQTPFDEQQSQVSPDGRWVAFTSSESGSEIWVAPFPAGDQKWLIGQGNAPRWWRDGREILYRAPGGRLMATAVSVEGGIVRAGANRLVVGGSGGGPRIAPVNTGMPFDTAPDGQRVLMITAPPDGTESLTLIVNWPARAGR